MTATKRIFQSAPMRRQFGAGLVEILVALSIGLVLTGGLIKIFINSKQTYRYQDALANVQENGRIALAMLKRNVRMASSIGGCVGNKPMQSTFNPSSLSSAGYIRNTLCPNNNYTDDFGQAVQGYEGSSSGAGWSPSLPSVLASEAILSGTDVLTIRGVQPTRIKVLKQPAAGTGQGPGSADLQIASNNQIKSGDILLAVDPSCQRAAIFQATNYNPNSGGFDNVVHNQAGGNCKNPSPSPGNQSKALGGNFTDGYVYSLDTYSYFLKQTSTGDPALYQKIGGGSAQQLVDNVADLQILYGVESAGQIQYLAANKVTDWGSVMSVRIYLLLRSAMDNVVAKPMSLFFDNAVWPAPDKRLYQTVSTTISIRNRAL